MSCLKGHLLKVGHLVLLFLDSSEAYASAVGEQ